MGRSRACVHDVLRSCCRAPGARQAPVADSVTDNEYLPKMAFQSPVIEYQSSDPSLR